MHAYSEVNQLRTQCAILESQIETLNSRNNELLNRIEQLETSLTPGFKTIPENNIGQVILGEDDGSFAL